MNMFSSYYKPEIDGASYAYSTKFSIVFPCLNLIKKNLFI